tara:strand:- start:245 stop:544 length:300 start_codon:yes stop_codon:yes gene_type:complete
MTEGKIGIYKYLSEGKEINCWRDVNDVLMFIWNHSFGELMSKLLNANFYELEKHRQDYWVEKLFDLYSNNPARIWAVLDTKLQCRLVKLSLEYYGGKRE